MVSPRRVLNSEYVIFRFQDGLNRLKYALKTPKDEELVLLLHRKSMRETSIFVFTVHM